MNHPKDEEMITPKTPTEGSTSERVKDCPPAPSKKKEPASTADILLEGTATGDNVPCSENAVDIKPTRLFPER